MFARMASLPALLVSAALAGGCSITLPFMGKALDDEPEVVSTAALPTTKSALSFSADLGSEDLRRAHAALGVALDPQGNGAAVAWSNPESGAKGQFTPVGSPFLKNDEICRSFIASTELQSGQIWQQGTACRLSGSDWLLKELQAFRKP